MEGTYEYSVKSFRVVRRGQCARVLHVAAQVPELLEPNAGDVDDVIGLRDRGHGVISIAQVRA